MNFSTPIGERKGVGEKTRALFEKIGVYTVGDILLYFPRTYIAYPPVQLANEVRQDGVCALCITPRKAPLTRRGRNMQITVLSEMIGDVNVSCVWFRRAYISKIVRANVPVIFYGRASVTGNTIKLEQPLVFGLDEYKAMRRTLQPVYSLTSGLTSKQIAKVLRGIFDEMGEGFDFPPSSDKRITSFSDIKDAFFNMHFPTDTEQLATARNHFVYDELFWFILRMQFGKSKLVLPNKLSMNDDKALNYAKKLPYELTGAQKRALDEILGSFRKDTISQHLVQGDVGSGKTVVAYFAMLDMHLNGYSSVLMAPTEVLANQHFETFSKMNKMLGVSAPIILLTGSSKGSVKKEIHEAIKDTPGAMIIGTHALFWKTVQYNNLGLVVTDEQHRFGVKQRQALFEKGDSTHILVMSATPIPRTLAMIIYGDMDIVVIDEMPAGRKPIKNALISEKDRMQAYGFIKKQVKAGHQVYVICPFVEASESVEGENVEDYSAKLCDMFRDIATVGMLHGKMSSDQKNRVMEAFAKGETDILVSTTVVEVGVNVPNATLMVIENAGRFGLASLHQLRGRVGRGADESFCIFIADLSKDEARQRLEILSKSNDGFKIASEDLKLRGPGDFLGIRQSGDMSFKLADIYQDAAILKEASKDVKAILDDDPELLEHIELARHLNYLSEKNSLLL